MNKSNNMPEYDRPKFHGDAGLAKELGVSKITVFRLRHANKIKCFRIGKKVVYSQRHLNEYLHSTETSIEIQSDAT